MILAIAISLQSISDWVMEREKMKCQFEVKLPLKRRKTYLLKFFHLYPVFCSTAVWCLAMSLIAIVLRLIRLWIVVCMLIRIFFFGLEMNKTTPTQYLLCGEKAHCFVCAFLSPFPSTLQCLWGAAADLLCSLCSPAVRSVICACLHAGKRRSLGNWGGHVWEWKKIYGPVLSWDSKGLGVFWLLLEALRGI